MIKYPCTVTHSTKIVNIINIVPAQLEPSKMNVSLTSSVSVLGVSVFAWSIKRQVMLFPVQHRVASPIL